jgi:hypothetical protein
MFYFLIFHTSISASKTIDKKILATFLYGSVLYLILHGLIKTSKYAIFKHLADYYWYCIIIDIAILIYLTRGIIDYSGIFERFIDTSAYSGLEKNISNNEKPLFKTEINSHNINDYINNVKERRVNINEEANEVRQFNNNETPNSIIRQPKITTAKEMGLEQSTSLEELGINDITEINENEPKETGISLPDGTMDFFAENIDVTDHISNISDIDLDDFAKNLE